DAVLADDLVGDVRGEVGCAVQLQVGLADRGREAVVEGPGVGEDRSDGVQVSTDDEGGNPHTAPVLVEVPRGERDGGLQVGTLGGQTQAAAAAHGVAHDRQPAAVDPAAHRGRGVVDHVVQRGVELAGPAVRLVEGGVGVDGDDDEAVGGD